MLFSFAGPRLTTAIFLSLWLHLMLIFLMSMKFHFTSSALLPATQNSLMISSYFYQPKFKTNSARHTTSAYKPHFSHAPTHFITQKKAIRKEPVFSPSLGQKMQPASLITLLHAAIQQQQVYPENAVNAQQEGDVSVMFTLFPDGHIDHLHLITTSGTTALDEAALHAVKKAAPFAGVDRYLSTPQTYQLTISFQLT